MERLTKFKVGDEVVCVSNSIARVKVGDKFIVEDVRPKSIKSNFYPELVYIEVDGILRNYSPKHFELVKEEEMSRDKIVNKTADPPVSKTPPPKQVNIASQWFGYKYKVNPETSRLLQEAVFKDGGRWTSGGTVVDYLNEEYLYVGESGKLSMGGDSYHFETRDLPEKQPPQACSLYEANNTCVGVERPKKEYTAYVKFDNYYKTYAYRLSEDIYNQIYDKKDVKLNVEVFDKQLNKDIIKQVNLVSILHEEDISATKWIHSVYEEPIKQVSHKHLGLCNETPLHTGTFECTIVETVTQTNEIFNQQEEINMSNANRRVVNVKLLDNDSGLPVEHALVASFSNIVTEDSNDVVVQEILLSEDVAGAIEEHNGIREEQTDLEILKRTGSDVKLRPIKLKDLTWVVTTA